MNYSMIGRLILKDWYLQRWPILGSVAAGMATLGITISGSKAAFILGVIAFVTVLIGIGALLVMSTTVLERKEQTLAFIMSLPISYREYTAAKILGNLLIFLVPWLTLALGSFAIVLFAPGVPRGLLPFAALMSTEILLSTCLIVSVGLISESESWTTGAIMMGSLLLNGFGYYVSHVASIARGMWGPAIQWSSAATALLLAEFAGIVLLLSLSFVFQARKKDYL